MNAGHGDEPRHARAVSEAIQSDARSGSRISLPDPLGLPVSAARGVGRERVQLLNRLRIETVGDLLFHGPRRYEDRRQLCRIKELVEGQSVTVRGSVVAAGVRTFRGGGKCVFEVVLDDGSARLHCRWWNQPYMEKFFAVGDQLFAYGKATSIRPRAMDHPETEKITDDGDEQVHLNRIVPVYPATEGLTQRALRLMLWRAIEDYADLVGEPTPRLVPTEPDPEKPLQIPWLRRPQAIRDLHFPAAPSAAEQARRRLALDEFVALQLTIQQRRLNLERKWRARPCGGDNRLMKPFLTSLPFKLTRAQTRVLREIRAELGSTVPMRRLLQGDVGSGKSLVAACAALMVLESGYNVVLMAPTEILAEQLWSNFRRWFDPLGVAIDLRTGSRKTEGELPLTSSAFPAPRLQERVVIGTHALVQESFQLDRIGLVIIDEQHKFGVAQREALLRKGRTASEAPHLLVMTATPIPRTLGLTLYGDLDVSILDELPSGRGQIRTYVRSPEALPKVWAFVREELAKGRQAYVVYSRVSEAEQEEIKAVTKEFSRVESALAPHPVGLLHGQLGPEEKERVMAAFRTGGLKALVTTSVIEVGVDVPNATVMVIENAEQFGLAQLHQLRGRIGRGGHHSHCVLLARQKTEESVQRMKVMAGTNNGFDIAEADLALRGVGELVGRDQSGIPDFRFGSLAQDRDLVETARHLAWNHLRGTINPTGG